LLGLFGSLFLTTWVFVGFFIILFATILWLGKATLVGKQNSRRLWLYHISFFGASGENVIEESSRELNYHWKD